MQVHYNTNIRAGTVILFYEAASYIMIVGELPVLAKDILEVPFPESEDEPPPPIPPRAPH